MNLGKNTAVIHIAILDDYQNAALASADWDSIAGAEITVFNQFIDGEDAVAKALEPFQVLVAKRERTRFPASHMDRLPNLKCLVTTGMRNLAMDAARQRGIVASGTGMPGFPAFEHAWALILAVAKQILDEDRIMSV